MGHLIRHSDVIQLCCRLSASGAILQIRILPYKLSRTGTFSNIILPPTDLHILGAISLKIGHASMSTMCYTHAGS
jgi:hypothetical protein